MTRSKPPLHNHLLTRSDLARLQVPAGDVLAWLADGSIEQVGVLPTGDDGASDPVFTVLPNRLRQELALRLLEIGKPTVVLTPLRVRSFLMRALLKPATSGQSTPAVEQTAEDLAEVLREVVAEVEADVADVMRLAEEEATLEAQGTPEAIVEAAEATRRAAEMADDGAAPGEDIEDVTDAVMFDADEITRALDALLPPEPPSASAAGAAVESGPEPAPLHTPTPTSEHAVPAANEPESTMASDPESVPTTAQAAATVASTAVAESALPIETASPTSVEPREHEQALEKEVVVEAPGATASPAEGAATNVAEPAMPTESSAPLAPTTPGASTTEPAADLVPAHELAEAALHRATEAVLEQTMQRVESFLGELQKSLTALAQRPEPATPPPPPAPEPAPTPPAPVDLTPLVQVVQTGFERSAQAATAAVTAAATATGAALTTFGERLDGIGERIGQGLGQIDGSVQALGRHVEASAARSVPGIVLSRTDRMPFVLMAVAALVIAWSVVFWIKLDSPRLAIATLVGANLVGCSLLTAARQRT